MALLIGLVLVAAGAALAVAQVHWAARSGPVPSRLGHVSEPLPPRWRYGSDIAIGVLLVGGAVAIQHGRPGWMFYVAVAGAAAVAAAAQAIALRTLPERIRH